MLRKGTKRRHHFAHKVEMFNCNPETLLHKMFKEQAAKYLQNLIDDNDLCLMYWQCSQCKKEYRGNLLYMVKSLAVEFDLGVCRPDILLFDSDKRPIIAIEIVVTHKPEPQVEEYYKKNGIVLCQINLSSNDDLDYIEEKLLFPDVVNFCLVPDCGFLENNHHYESYVIDVFKEMLPSGNLHNIIKYDHLTPFGRYKTEQHETKPGKLISP